MIEELKGWLFVVVVLAFAFLVVEGALYGRALDRADERRKRPTLLDLLRRADRR